MSKIHVDTTRERIFAAIAKNAEERHSKRIGASWIGSDCDRAIWYKFRWAKKCGFDGRMLRLFRTGKLAEQLLADDLRATGATVLDVDPDTGEQFFFEDLGGHLCGFMDGAGVGFIEAPVTWHVIEYKTCNEKSFAEIEKKGVEESKPTHYAQMQLYMGWSGMNRALYVALNKNTDDIYIERIEFNKHDFVSLRQRAREIIGAIDPPDRLSESPAFYKCKMCEFSGICHETGDVAERNCRTCIHSVATEEGNALWVCDRHGIIIEQPALQEAGCADHAYRAGMCPQAAIVAAKVTEGKVVGNG